MNENKFNAKTRNIKTLLENDNFFDIPLYQRNYSWTINEVKELFDDLNEFVQNYIKNDVNSNKIYYMGNIIWRIDDDRRILIDGQQRITTFFIFLKAFKDVVENNFSEFEWFDDFKDNINQMIFHNSNEENNIGKKIKLLNINDNFLLSKILMMNFDELENNLLLEEKKSLFFNNYKEMYKSLSKVITDENEIKYWFDYLLRKITFVCINIPEKQKEHKIFENINSKGKDLTITDLIKNYLYIYAEKVFENEEEENKIKNLFDNKISKHFDNDESSKFFRQIIAYFTGVLITITKTKELYKKIKEIIPIQDKSKEKLNEFISFLEKAFDTYQYIKSFKNRKPIDEYTYILEKYYDQLSGVYFTIVLRNAMINAEFTYENDKNRIEINNDFKDVIKTIAEWSLKAKIVYSKTDFHTRTAPLIFRNYSKNILTREIFLMKLKNPLDEENIDETKKYHMPSNANIKRALYENEISEKNMRQIVYMINNHINKEYKIYEKTDKIAIEHIMPREISELSCWKKSLGDDWVEKHEKLVYKLGNLTLTWSKDFRSNYCFSNNDDINFKKQYFANSDFTLTRDLAKLDNFDEEEIMKRTEELAKIFVSIFK